MNKPRLKLQESEGTDTPDRKAYRKRIAQSDVPGYSLEQALRVPRAIAESYASKPSKPLDVAAALDMTLNSGQFRGISGAAVAYGLTIGASGVSEISITPLGMKIVRPLAEGEELPAMREAVLQPRIFAEFLSKYNEAPLPKSEIACNVLVSMGVPQDRAIEVLKLLLESAEHVGFIRHIKDKRYIDLSGVASAITSKKVHNQEVEQPLALHTTEQQNNEVQTPTVVSEPLMPTNSRVFITHGKNTDIVGQLKELLAFGNFVPVVAAEHETVSKPVPDKVMDEMRSCYAAIIHVGKEIKLLDQEGKEHIFVNQNVLIEIGAAMALYGRRFILLVERGATLPSNLQGLYEVRYEGDKLDYDATMKLLKAFNEFKT